MRNFLCLLGLHDYSPLRGFEAMDILNGYKLAKKCRRCKEPRPLIHDSDK